MQPESSKKTQFIGEKSYLESEIKQKPNIFPRKKTESITFRLESEILDRVRQEAKIKGIFDKIHAKGINA
jgi:predicted DNA binding CopG/RHH family protein